MYKIPRDVLIHSTQKHSDIVLTSYIVINNKFDLKIHDLVIINCGGGFSPLGYPLPISKRKNSNSEKNILRDVP